MDSHQRRVVRREIQKVLSSQSEIILASRSPLERVEAGELSAIERICLFFENGVVLTAMSTAGSLAGVFADGRYFLILCVPILFGLRRSNALKGLSIRYTLITYSVVLGVSAYSLWVLGSGVNKSRSKIPSPKEIADQVWSGHLPFSTTINQIYTAPAPLESSAAVKFGFDSEDKGLPDSITLPAPFMTLGINRHLGNLDNLPLPSRVVKVKFLARSSSDIVAKGVHAWVTICDGCDFAAVPSEFSAASDGRISVVNAQLGDIPVGIVRSLGEFSIALPLHGNSAQVALAYTCDNCKGANGLKKPKILTIKTLDPTK